MSNMVTNKRAKESTKSTEPVMSAEELSHLIGETLIEGEGKKTPNGPRTVHYIRSVPELVSGQDILPEVVEFINRHSDFVVVKIKGKLVVHGYDNATEAIENFNSLA